MIRFTCGCTSKLEIPIVQEEEDVEEAMKTLSTFDSLAWDHGHFLICAVHRARRSGWRSVPYVALRPEGLPADMTELEWERWELFRIEPKRGISNEKQMASGAVLSGNGVRDSRDNRDPADLFQRLQQVKRKSRIKKLSTAQDRLSE